MGLLDRLKKTVSLNSIFKWSIATLLFYTLYNQIFAHNEFSNFLELVQSISMTDLVASLSVLVVLNIFNWTVETFRWKILMELLDRMPWKNAIQATLSGLTLGIMTPNRIGEFVGKVIYIERANKIRGVLLTLVASFSMTMIAMLFGVIAFPFLYWKFHPVSFQTFVLLEVGFIVLFLFMGWNYFNIDIMSKYLFRLKWLKKFYSYRSTARLLNVKGLLSYLGLSLIRYAILITQYLIILNLLNVEYYMLDAVFAVAFIYFVQTVLPTPAIVELGIRGHAATAIIGMITASSTINIVTAAYGLWLINVTFPALIGGVLLMRFDFNKVIE